MKATLKTLLKKIGFVFFITCTLINNTAFTQPALSYQHCFGGSGDDGASIIISTNDRGYLIVGSTESNDFDVTNSHGSIDVWLIKLDSSLNPIWKKCYGGTLGDGGVSAVQTADGGFVVLANSESNDGDVSGNHGLDDVWIFRIDSAGSILWQKSFGGSYDETGMSIKLTSVNEILITGITQSFDGDLSSNNGFEDVFLLKLNLNGSIIWARNFGGSDEDDSYDVIEINNGAYLIAGNTFSNDSDVSFNHGTTDVWLLAVDSSGQLLWEKTYGGLDFDQTANIIMLDNGNYFFTASSSSLSGNVTGNHGGTDFWMVIVDSSSKNIYKQICYGGTLNDEPIRVFKTSGDSILAVGYSYSSDGNLTSNNGGYDSWIICVDTALNFRWQKSLGGSMEDGFTGISVNNVNAILTVGYTCSNDSDVTGNHSNISCDVWVTTLDWIITKTELNVIHNTGFQVFPNPTKNVLIISSENDYTNCKIEIKNMEGKLMFKTINSLFAKYPKVFKTDYSPGFYLLKISNESVEIYNTKFLVIN